MQVGSPLADGPVQLYSLNVPYSVPETEYGILNNRVDIMNSIWTIDSIKHNLTKNNAYYFFVRFSGTS